MRNMTGAQLSSALQKKAPQITRWKKRGMPHDCDDKGRALFDADECRAWIAANTTVGHPNSTDEQSDKPLGVGDLFAGLSTLESSDAAPLDIARQTVRVASQSLAAGIRRGQISTNAVEGLKRALEELRKSEAAWQDLAVRSGELIERSVAKAAIGELVRRLRECFDQLASNLPHQVEHWMADDAIRMASSEERTRIVRSWVDHRCASIRNDEADAVECLLKHVEEDISHG